MRKRVIFELSAYKDFKNWAKLDREIYRKIIVLLKSIERSSSIVTQQAKPLKRELHGYWSIEINQKHRLVYKVTSTAIIVASCRYY